MIEQNESVLKILKELRSLRHFLKSEIQINDPKEGEVLATVKVYNTSQLSPNGGNIVFMGVGLHITEGSERGNQRGSAYWPRRINKSRTSDCIESRQQYTVGTWNEVSFPLITANEQSHGEVLFPGESVN